MPHIGQHKHQTVCQATKQQWSHRYRLFMFTWQGTGDWERAWEISREETCYWISHFPHQQVYSVPCYKTRVKPDEVYIPVGYICQCQGFIILPWELFRHTRGFARARMQLLNLQVVISCWYISFKWEASSKTIITVYLKECHTSLLFYLYQKKKCPPFLRTVQENGSIPASDLKAASSWVGPKYTVCYKTYGNNSWIKWNITFNMAPKHIRMQSNKLSVVYSFRLSVDCCRPRILHALRVC